MKFTWLSNAPWTCSGYGQQTRIFLKRLKALGHEPGMIAYFGLEGSMLSFDGYPVFPKRYHPYGNDVAVVHTMRGFGTKVMFSLTDTWVLNAEEYPYGYRWIPWYPVDHENMPEIIRRKLLVAWKRVTFSKHGVAATNAVGLDCTYIPHGIETSIFKPRDKEEARKQLGLPNDKWIIGTVAMNKGNPSRKNFVEMMHAYKLFHERHTDTLYVLQTDRGEGMNDMVNLPELCKNLGLVEGRDVIYCDQYQNAVGFDPLYMANLYSALDVHMLVSAGEGFGIPILEAQACGCPVIVGDWTSMSELCFSGQKVDKRDAQRVYTGLAAYQYKPDYKAIDRALELEYRKPSSKKKAIDGAQAYDADLITQQYWKPFLEECEERIALEDNELERLTPAIQKARGEA